MNSENEFNLNGRRYVAVVMDPDDACTGCVFDDEVCPFNLSCRCNTRRDGRDIIWVEASEDKEEEKRE